MSNITSTICSDCGDRVHMKLLWLGFLAWPHAIRKKCRYRNVRPHSLPAGSHSFVGMARETAAMPPASKIDKNNRSFTSVQMCHTHTLPRQGFVLFWKSRRVRVYGTGGVQMQLLLIFNRHPRETCFVTSWGSESRQKRSSAAPFSIDLQVPQMPRLPTNVHAAVWPRQQRSAAVSGRWPVPCPMGNGPRKGLSVTSVFLGHSLACLVVRVCPTLEILLRRSLSTFLNWVVLWLSICPWPFLTLRCHLIVVISLKSLCERDTNVGNVSSQDVLQTSCKGTPSLWSCQ